MANYFAYAVYRFLQGDDTTEELWKFLRLNKYVDEDDEWIYEEDGDI